MSLLRYYSLLTSTGTLDYMSTSGIVYFPISAFQNLLLNSSLPAFILLKITSDP